MLVDKLFPVLNRAPTMAQVKVKAARRVCLHKTRILTLMDRLFLLLHKVLTMVVVKLFQTRGQHSFLVVADRIRMTV